MQVSTRSDPTQVLPATFEFGYLVCGLACSWLLVCVMLLFRTAGYCRARQIQSAFDCCWRFREQEINALWSCHQILVNTNDSERKGIPASGSPYPREVHQEVLLAGPDSEKATP